MTIQVFLPQDMASLQRELANVHAELALSQVNRLTCPLEVKRNIIDTVREAVLQEAAPATPVKTKEDINEHNKTNDRKPTAD